MSIRSVFAAPPAQNVSGPEPATPGPATPEAASREAAALQRAFENFAPLVATTRSADGNAPFRTDVDELLHTQATHSWKRNHMLIEHVRATLTGALAHAPTREQQRIKAWFRGLLELHFGLRYRQLRTRRRYREFFAVPLLFADPKATAACGLDEALAHFHAQAALFKMAEGPADRA
jgi:hypothetical protein